MVKQVIVIRKDLQMTKGKMIAQGSHASLGVIMNMLSKSSNIEEFEPKVVNGKYNLSMEVIEDSDLDSWLRGGFAKICLYVNSEEELTEIYDKAIEKGLPSILIEDAGLTMFKGIVTKTCVAIGPAKSEDIDSITGHLKLL